MIYYRATYSLAISHTPWRPERVASLQRLKSQLFPLPDTVDSHFVFGDRCPNYVWSMNMWSWAYQQPVTHHLFLQDDVVVAPGFWDRLNDLCLSREAEIIGLEAAHPAAMTLAREGKSWYTTADGLIGVGYVLTHEVLGEFLSWRANELLPGAVEAITEDTLIDVFALDTGTPIHHPIPTIIDHDLSLDSTYGNDAHSHRAPYVTWRDDALLPDVADLDTPHLGRFYGATHWLARAHVRGWSPEKHAAAEADVCPAKYRRFFQ